MELKEVEEFNLTENALYPPLNFRSSKALRISKYINITVFFAAATALIALTHQRCFTLIFFKRSIMPSLRYGEMAILSYKLTSLFYLAEKFLHNGEKIYTQT